MTDEEMEQETMAVLSAALGAVPGLEGVVLLAVFPSDTPDVTNVKIASGFRRRELSSADLRDLLLRAAAMGTS